MMPISGVDTGAVQPITTTEDVLGASKIQGPKEEIQGLQLRPMMDRYVPEGPQEPSGLYWMSKDEDGQPKICFDDPEQAVPGQPEGVPVSEGPDPADQDTKGPERKKDKDEVWECNTDKVDHEVEELKKQQQELEQRLDGETDEVKIKDLERQLAQVERELKQKDNDTYRERNATFTQLS
ncbi:hypothetical protein D7V91_06615 [bacterium 1xD42-67]|nr:hypothetical protein D7V91_06615 [bacterium 1xD42-67]